MKQAYQLDVEEYMLMLMTITSIPFQTTGKFFNWLQVLDFYLESYMFSFHVWIQASNCIVFLLELSWVLYMHLVYLTNQSMGRATSLHFFFSFFFFLDGYLLL